MSNNRTPRRGVLLIVSSPSGAGKTSLCRRLMADHPELVLSISATTREIRPGEVADRDYHFVSNEAFDNMIAEDAFMEWADVHGNRYGSRPYGGPGGTTMYGPGGYRGGVSPRPGVVGPTRVGPPTPGYGGPTPPPEDPYERAQRAVVPRSRQRTPAAAEQPSATTPPPAAESDAPRQRHPSRETSSPPPPAKEAAPPAAQAAPKESTPAASSGRATGSTSRATGSTTGRRAVPRP